MRKSWSVMRGAWLLMLLLPVVLTGCGHKGRLKSPSQIEAEQAKKEHKEAKNAAEEEKKQEKKEITSPFRGED